MGRKDRGGEELQPSAVIHVYENATMKVIPNSRLEWTEFSTHSHSHSLSEKDLWGFYILQQTSRWNHTDHKRAERVVTERASEADA